MVCKPRPQQLDRCNDPGTDLQLTFEKVLDNPGGRHDAFGSPLQAADKGLSDVTDLLDTARKSLALYAIECARRGWEGGRASVVPVHECKLTHSLFADVISTPGRRTVVCVQQSQQSSSAMVQRRHAAAAMGAACSRTNAS
jgi:hypothetical protein